MLFSRESTAMLDAINRSQAVIEFDLNGTVLGANENFLSCIGYAASEIAGKHHSMFVTADNAQSAEYKSFWEALRKGEHKSGVYLRIGKGGKEVWLQASYNPILDRRGKPLKVVKFASDISLATARSADFEGQIKAIDKSQAVIEFELDGSIITANQHFLTTLGYQLHELQGKHHRMFVAPEFARSLEYRSFWDKLQSGEFQAGEFKRVGKGDRPVWIQATYNPIADAGGRICKVVKFAVDVTKAVEDRVRRVAIQKQIDADLGKISAAINDTAARITSTVGASTQTSSSMQSVASGAEELAASVAEISRRTSDALNISRQAVEQADETSAIVAGLSSSAQKIGDVVKLISDIADQTNLLALNATIEAARAGEAGRGFAVVAAEVKSLASQTAKATDEITAQINEVQSATNRSVTVIESIGKTIAQVSEISAAIAASVEEQAAVTQSMSASMQNAAQGVSEINTNMTEISQATKAVEHATLMVKDASRQVA